MSVQRTKIRLTRLLGSRFLLWLRDRLHDLGYEADEPGSEDWGWYVELSAFDSAYLVGACGFPEEREDASVEWHIQIHKLRSLLDKLAMRNKLALDDPLSQIIEGFVRDEPEFTEVEIDRS